MKWALSAVILGALLTLGVRAAGIGMAGDELDPVGHISAQDEALYAHSAIRMAVEGGWMTPMFLGRYGLYKPPLLMWAAGGAARVFGVSRLALRAPVVLAAAGVVVMVFLWVGATRGWAAAAGAAMLVVSNRLWQVLGAMCLTDGLLAAAMTAAVYCLWRDPGLKRRGWTIGFGIAAAVGILAKSVAGAMPLLMLAAWWLMAGRELRPRWTRVLAAGALAVTIAAPWFVYQAMVHSRWFWAEHVGLELVAYGTRTPPQTSTESQWMFYLGRQWAVDPVMAVLALLAVPGWVAALRRRDSRARLLLIWIAIPAVGVIGWQYRNLSYLLPLVPALAVLAASYGPVFGHRTARAALAMVVVALMVKAACPERTWGLSWRPGTTVQVAPALAAYCGMGRGNQLVQFGMDDALYATTLPLARVRYAFVGAADAPRDYALDFRGMGIMMTAAEFAGLPGSEAEWRPRLRSWGLESAEALGTVVLARSREETLGMVRAQPGMDYFVGEGEGRWLGAQVTGTHEVVSGGAGRVFLLSRTALGGGERKWGCGL